MKQMYLGCVKGRHWKSMPTVVKLLLVNLPMRCWKSNLPGSQILSSGISAFYNKKCVEVRVCAKQWEMHYVHLSVCSLIHAHALGLSSGTAASSNAKPWEVLARIYEQNLLLQAMKKQSSKGVLPVWMQNSLCQLQKWKELYVLWVHML